MSLIRKAAVVICAVALLGVSRMPCGAAGTETGVYCTVDGPATLDLVERAAIGLHGLSGVLDPSANYEFWFGLHYDTHPPWAAHDARSFAACGPKLLESFPMLITMSGEIGYNKAYEGLESLLLSWIDDDGLMYCKVGPERPWDRVAPEDWANVYGQARMMLAMMAIYQTDGNPEWLKRIGKMSDGLCGIAVDKGDYAYYPANMGNEQVKIGEGYCYLKKSGWLNADEAQSEIEGTEGSMFMYHCGVIRALARWYLISGDRKAWEMAGKLVNYVMREQYWGSEYGWPKTADRATKRDHYVKAWKVVTSERGQFTGHFHGHTAMLFALAEYANAANNAQLKDFVRSSYEYARNQGIARLGLFGETCTISDMVAIAIKLTEGGVGDYWDDVDGYIRNQLIEQQLTSADYLRKVSEASAPPSPELAPAVKPNLIERTVGVFCDDADLGCIPGTLSIQCCTANGTQALYYAWEGIVRKKPDGLVQVNLLLNRVSPWMDIFSYIPYEGKVVLKNKTARTLALRIPGWVDASLVKCAVNGKGRNYELIGRYAVLDGLKPKDEIVFTFPLEEETATYTVVTQQQWTSDPRVDKNPLGGSIAYKCVFKGNTLVDFSPRPDDRWYPTYQRDSYKQSKAPMVTAKRFVAEKIVKW